MGPEREGQQEESNLIPEQINPEALEILKMMAEGATLYNFYIDGGVALCGVDSKFMSNKVPGDTFRDLNKSGYIEKTDEIGKGDLRFPHNTKGDIYSITEKGQEILQGNTL